MTALDIVEFSNVTFAEEFSYAYRNFTATMADIPVANSRIASLRVASVAINTQLTFVGVDPTTSKKVLEFTNLVGTRGVELFESSSIFAPYAPIYILSYDVYANGNVSDFQITFKDGSIVESFNEDAEDKLHDSNNLPGDVSEQLANLLFPGVSRAASLMLCAAALLLLLICCSLCVVCARRYSRYTESESRKAQEVRDQDRRRALAFASRSRPYRPPDRHVGLRELHSKSFNRSYPASDEIRARRVDEENNGADADVDLDDLHRMEGRGKFAHPKKSEGSTRNARQVWRDMQRAERAQRRLATLDDHDDDEDQGLTMEEDDVPFVKQSGHKAMNTARAPRPKLSKPTPSYPKMPFNEQPPTPTQRPNAKASLPVLAPAALAEENSPSSPSRTKPTARAPAMLDAQMPLSQPLASEHKEIAPPRAPTPDGGPRRPSRRLQAQAHLSNGPRIAPLNKEAVSPASSSRVDLPFVGWSKDKRMERWRSGVKEKSKIIRTSNRT